MQERIEYNAMILPWGHFFSLQKSSYSSLLLAFHTIHYSKKHGVMPKVEAELQHNKRGVVCVCVCVLHSVRGHHKVKVIAIIT